MRRQRQTNGTIARFAFVLCAAVALSVNIVPSFALSQAKKSNPVAIKGVLLIQWSDETRFIYVSPADNPLRFTTRSDREVRPGRMYTDGGSIPRLFWSVKGFSPWGSVPLMFCTTGSIINIAAAAIAHLIRSLSRKPTRCSTMP